MAASIRVMSAVALVLCRPAFRDPLRTFGGKVAQEGLFWYSFYSVPDRGSATAFLPLSAEIGWRFVNSVSLGAEQQ